MRYAAFGNLCCGLIVPTGPGFFARVLWIRISGQCGETSRLLLRIGREYEATYSAALRAVDRLKVIDNPSKKDLRRLREEVPHSDPAMRRFFEEAGAGWFTRLREAGYLSDPPPLQVGDDGFAVYTPWPAGRYLVRMADVRSLSDAVVDVALGLDTDNPEACECVAEAALILNADAAAQLAPRLPNLCCGRSPPKSPR
jgi:hypothetical protein